MSTKIQWTSETWNPITGCDRISPGCGDGSGGGCYALTLAGRLKAMGQPKYQRDGDPRTSGSGFGVTCHPDELDRPLRWRDPRVVFVCSMADLFHHAVPDEFITRVFGTMTLAKQHTFQVLTKRPQRMADLLAYDDHPHAALHWPLPNVWLGTSIENRSYRFRASALRATPAAVRFLSLEPLLGRLGSRVELLQVLEDIDWVIVGGESGPRARPLDLAWVRDIREACAFLEIPLFVKQLGTAWSAVNGHGRGHGGEPQLWPEDLRIREMPPVVVP